MVNSAPSTHPTQPSTQTPVIPVIQATENISERARRVNKEILIRNFLYRYVEPSAETSAIMFSAFIDKGYEDFLQDIDSNVINNRALAQSIL